MQDAALWLFSGLGGTVVLGVALAAEVSAKDASTFQMAFIVTGLIIFATATISGVRQLKALRNRK